LLVAFPALALAAGTVGSAAGGQAGVSQPTVASVPNGGSQAMVRRGGAHQPIVRELEALLKRCPDLAKALEASLAKADYRDIRSLPRYFTFLDDLATLVPAERDLKPRMLEFYYLVSRSPGIQLQQDPRFAKWMVKFAQEWGSFLDTPESAIGLATFLKDPAYRMDDYFQEPSGWRTFNQFFARECKPGRRPVDGPCDDGIIVSPADSVFHGQWPIDDNATIIVKGTRLAIRDLLAGSPWAERFRGGVFIHSFLDVNDYHRFHTPVRGKVLESRKIPGKVFFEVTKRPDGTLEDRDGATYQFTQDRGILVLDSPVGLVAVLPIGMAQVSSVNLVAEPGAELRKGDLFGFFLFGGSDIIVLFEPGRVAFDAEVGTHYAQGRQIGHAAVALQIAQDGVHPAEGRNLGTLPFSQGTEVIGAQP
jgi:phosphatidylserine decarboxylase precursor